MSDINFNLSRAQVLIPNETWENVFVSVLNICLIFTINNIFLTILRSNGACNTLRLSEYFDYVAHQELFSLRTWIAWWSRLPEISIDNAVIPEKPSRGIANRRIVKAMIAHSLIAGVEFLALVLFSRSTKQMFSEQVGVVARYRYDGLDKIPVGNCIVSSPEKRREQLNGIFLTCADVSSSYFAEVVGDVNFTMTALHSSLAIDYVVSGKQVESTIRFLYSFKERLDVKLDEYVNDRVVTALSEAFALDGCEFIGSDIADGLLSGCKSLNVSHIAMSVAQTVGYVGGNYSMGTANDEAQVFEEAQGVEIGTYTSTTISLIYLPVCVGVSMVVHILVVLTLRDDAQRVVNLMVLEKAGQVCSLGYLFVDKGEISVQKWEDGTGSWGHIGTEGPVGMEVVKQFSDAAVIGKLGNEIVP